MRCLPDEAAVQSTQDELSHIFLKAASGEAFEELVKWVMEHQA